MRVNRSLILVVLALLTICFLGAAYALWFNPTGLPLVGAGGLETPSPARAMGVDEGQRVVQLTVAETGIAAVTAKQLRAAGLSFEQLSSSELSLTHDGRPVPFLVRTVDEEPVLYFYAQAELDPHEPLAVYELQQGEGVALSQRSARPFNKGVSSGQHALNWREAAIFDEDGEAGNAWRGPLLVAPSRWTLHLDGVQPDGGQAQMEIDLFTNVKAEGEEQHHVQILVNERTVAEHLWHGSGRKSLSIPLAAGTLNSDGPNGVVIEVHDDTAPMGEAIYVDAVRLSYQGPVDVSERAVTFTATEPNLRISGVTGELLVFDISDPAAPVVLTDFTMEGDEAELSTGVKEPKLIALNPEASLKPQVAYVPMWRNSLLDERWAADYIAIVADVRGFEEALAPLLAHRQEQGLRVAAVPVEQIFDEFGHGHRDPQAIKDFISYAVSNWTPPAPRYVLLVGDANYDVTNRVPGKNRNRLPTKMVYAVTGEHVASDSWYAAQKDNVPLVAIGRFPAQNAPQLSNMVSKTIAYEELLRQGDTAWLSEALLVADDEPVYEETIGDLADYLDEEGYSVYRLQLDDDVEIHHNIVSAINQGVGLVSYMGRGSAGTWGEEAAFQSEDAQALYNSSRLPILTTFTCRNGSFADPRHDSLAESLLRANSGGIIAAVAPSGEIADVQELPLTMLFHERIMDDGAARLGDRLLQMYDDVEDLPALREALIPVNLLGDPALEIDPLSQP